MYLIPVSALADNYLCLLHDGKHALAVNPGNAGQVMAVRNAHGPDLKSILVTHQQASHRISISLGKRAALRDNKAACRTHRCISANLRFSFTC
jgi:hydroxyacylglutathione hydrolase